MPTTLVSGLSGRVKANDLILGELNKWDITKTTAKVVTPTFESPTDADGNVWPTLLRGLSSASGSASGYLNVSPSDATDSGAPNLSNGLFAYLDLILVKSTPWGIPGVPVFIDEVAMGSDVNNQASPFSMKFTVNGVCGKTQLIT